MSNKKHSAAIKSLKIEVKDNAKEKRFKDAFFISIKLADMLKKEGHFEEALQEFQNSKTYIKNVTGEKKQEREYIADRAYLEAIFEKGKDTEVLHEHLQQFRKTYETLSHDIQIEQQKEYLLACLFAQLFKFSDAKIHAHKSLELVNKFGDYSIEYRIYKGSSFRIIADLLIAEDKHDEAKAYIKKGLDIEEVETDATLHYSLLNIHRNFVEREKRLDISLQMVDIYDKNKTELKSQKSNTYKCLSEDYLVRKDIAKAEEAYFMLYKDKECMNDEVKNRLILFYKWNERVAKSWKLREQLQKEKTFEEIALIYEKMCDELKSFAPFEILVEYHEAVLNLCKFMDGDAVYGNLKIFKRVLPSLIELNYDFGELNRKWGCPYDEYYDTAVEYINILLDIERKNQGSKSRIIKLMLNLAEKMVHSSKNVEQKLKAFTDVKDHLKDDMQKVKWYTNYIILLKACEKDVGDLETQLQLHQNKVKELNVQPKISKKYHHDEIDDITNDQILASINKKLEDEEKVEQSKKRIMNKKPSGESPLHGAVSRVNENNASKDPLEHLKFLIEKCGYTEIINNADNIGLTPLHLAVLYDKQSVVQYLMEKGARINTSTKEEFTTDNDRIIPKGTTPLMEACAQANIPLLKILIQTKADVKAAVDYLNSLLDTVDLNDTQSNALIKTLEAAQNAHVSENTVTPKSSPSHIPVNLSS